MVVVLAAAIEFEDSQDWYLLTNTNGNNIGLKNQVVKEVQVKIAVINVGRGKY